MKNRLWLKPLQSLLSFVYMKGHPKVGKQFSENNFTKQMPIAMLSNDVPSMTPS